MVSEVFFHKSIGCIFVLLMVPFVIQKLLIFMMSHSPIVLEPESLVFYLVTFPLCQRVWSFLPLSLLLDSMYLVLCLGPCSTWTWALSKVINMCIYFHSSTYRPPVRPAPFVEDAFFTPLCFLVSMLIKCTWVYGFISGS